MLQSKAFDMLVVLIESGGRPVGKEELFSSVWPNQIVEESNLTVRVSAIRKALGDHSDGPTTSSLYRARLPFHDRMQRFFETDIATKTTRY